MLTQWKPIYWYSNDNNFIVWNLKYFRISAKIEKVQKQIPMWQLAPVHYIQDVWPHDQIFLKWDKVKNLNKETWTLHKIIAMDFWNELRFYASKFPICQHFQTRPPVESRADRETLSLGDAESLYIMFCACLEFFHGNPRYSKQLCSAPAPLIPVTTKQTGSHSSSSLLSPVCGWGQT